MEIDVKKIEKIIHSDISTSEIEIMTGMSAQNVNKYRRGESRIERMTLENANKFCVYFDSLEQQGRVQPIVNRTDHLDYVMKFDSLPIEIKSLIVTRQFDKRAFTKNLQGYHLNYNNDCAFLYTQVHSGVGGGHPVYEFTENIAYIIPTRAYVTMTAGTIIEPVYFVQKIFSKWDLYNDYLNDKDNIIQSLSNIKKNNMLSKVNFEAQYQRIKE
ncbi:helix-turn-helix transcriptional regulator [Enterococcus faecalis]